MNRQQRILISIAVAAGLFIIANAVVTELFGPDDPGWFMYSPDDASVYATSDGSPFGAAAVRLAAVGMWLAVSWRLFRSHE